ncbi:hypothetical protein SAMN05421839_13929 [Halolactibacillus halophilus]|uniref:Uncharacterized protein n=1 Tax=Halolactibacillus halophilus TaxID=306540 RepID=A0A1I5S7A6_9BACI|nr:hypothetical protein [Halolactibacillus halophilus]GEM02768.1 hypothetical protein HHA03_23000 [Halolactibacillus halophilus]SFP66116.1 hypothetical protein SAMN05421839_13929 [Halolactibacillus halophilus]
MKILNFLKKKKRIDPIKVSALKQDVIAEIMESNPYKGIAFEGLSNKEVKSLERTQNNPVFEITDHKVTGFTATKKGKTCTVFYDDKQIGTVKSENMPEEKLDTELTGSINGGKRKYMDLDGQGGVKLFTKKSRYVLYLI